MFSPFVYLFSAVVAANNSPESAKIGSCLIIVRYPEINLGYFNLQDLLLLVAIIIIVIIINVGGRLQCLCSAVHGAF